MQGYVFRTGDALVVRQRKSGSNVHGGILVYGDDIGSFYNDQDGQRADEDSLGNGTWHNRRIPLDGLQGKTYSGNSGGGGTSTDYNFQFASIAVISSDGAVRTIFGGQASVSLGSGTGSIKNGSGASLVTPSDGNSSRFFVQDQVGTSQMEFSAAGDPLWRGSLHRSGRKLSCRQQQTGISLPAKNEMQNRGWTILLLDIMHQALVDSSVLILLW